MLDSANAPATPDAATAAAVAAAQQPRTPVGGAGLYDVDPPQRGVTQDPEVVPASDIAALPEDLGF